MSRRGGDLTTPADRIEAIRKSIPPPKGRNARQPYASKDDFAQMIGAVRSTVINWTTGKSYPEERYRLKLAQLSRGRFEPDDFLDPDAIEPRRVARRLEPRVAALEEQVERLERHILGATGAQER